MDPQSSTSAARQGQAIPVTVIPGDGVGPEIVRSALRIIEAAGVPIAWEEAEAGAEIFRRGDSSGVPQATRDSIERTRVVLKGPLETPIGFGEKSANVTLRKLFETYANVRPARELPGVPTRYSGEGVDMIIVRENIEDLYAGIEHMQTPGTAQALKLISHRGSEKIIRLAFELARAEGRKTVHCATKANILKLTEGLFKRVFEEVAQDYPEIRAEHMIVDNCAHQMVMRPEQFDVIVMTNMNGDILSDLASALIGGLGFAPSANLGDQASIFEAVHGSAPQIAGKDMANPTALISSAVLMLRHLGEMARADAVENALLATLEDGKALTTDIAGHAGVGTKAFTQEIIKNLGRAPKSYPRRDYKRLRLPRVDDATGAAVAHRVVGADVIVECAEAPAALGPRVEAATAGLSLKLAQISSRGAKVYPDEVGVTPEPGDCLRLRFKSVRADAAVSDAAILELLTRVAGLAPWVHVEKLSEFDGKPAFTKDSGED